MSHVLYHQTGMDPLYKVWHTSGAHMLILMHSEGGSIVCSEKTYPIRPGVLCFIGAEKYHYTMPDDPSVYDRSKLFIPPETMRRLMCFFPEHCLTRIAPDTIVYAQLSEEDAAAAERVFADAYAHSSDTVLAGCWLRLMAYLDANVLESIDSASGFLMDAINYIAAHLNEKLSVDSICAAAHVSKYHFCRQFKKAMGMTLMAYVLQTRLALAKSLLAQNSYSMRQISEQCGFGSLSHFSHVFRSVQGVSPQQYRSLLHSH